MCPSFGVCIRSVLACCRINSCLAGYLLKWIPETAISRIGNIEHGGETEKGKITTGVLYYKDHLNVFKLNL